MIQSLNRAIDIINILASDNKKFTITEISQEVDLPASTVHRILTTLCSRNFVSKQKDGSLYYLGPSLISLGKKATVFLNLQEIAKPILEELTAITTEDSYLIIKSGFNGVTIEEVQGVHPLRIVQPYGAELELHLGAIRRCLLAYQNKEYISNYIKNGLSKVTKNSIVEPKVLTKSLEEIRRRGYAVSFGEYVDYGYGIGAPVFDEFGNITASIGLVIPESRLNRSNEATIIEQVVSSGKKLSASLGYI